MNSNNNDAYHSHRASGVLNTPGRSRKAGQPTKSPQAARALGFGAAQQTRSPGRLSSNPAAYPPLPCVARSPNKPAGTGAGAQVVAGALPAQAPTAAAATSLTAAHTRAAGAHEPCQPPAQPPPSTLNAAMLAGLQAREASSSGIAPPHQPQGLVALPRTRGLSLSEKMARWDMAMQQQGGGEPTSVNDNSKPAVTTAWAAQHQQPMGPAKHVEEAPVAQLLPAAYMGNPPSASGPTAAAPPPALLPAMPASGASLAQQQAHAGSALSAAWPAAWQQQQVSATPAGVRPQPVAGEQGHGTVPGSRPGSAMSTPLGSDMLAAIEEMERQMALQRAASDDAAPAALKQQPPVTAQALAPVKADVSAVIQPQASLQHDTGSWGGGAQGHSLQQPTTLWPTAAVQAHAPALTHPPQASMQNQHPQLGAVALPMLGPAGGLPAASIRAQPADQGETWAGFPTVIKQPQQEPPSNASTPLSAGMLAAIQNMERAAAAAGKGHPATGQGQALMVTAPAAAAVPPGQHMPLQPLAIQPGQPLATSVQLQQQQEPPRPEGGWQHAQQHQHQQQHGSQPSAAVTAPPVAATTAPSPLPIKHLTFTPHARPLARDAAPHPHQVPALMPGPAYPALQPQCLDARLHPAAVGSNASLQHLAEPGAALVHTELPRQGISQHQNQASAAGPALVAHTALPADMQHLEGPVVPAAAAYAAAKPPQQVPLQQHLVAEEQQGGQASVVDISYKVQEEGEGGEGDSSDDDEAQGDDGLFPAGLSQAATQARLKRLGNGAGGVPGDQDAGPAPSLPSAQTPPQASGAQLSSGQESQDLKALETYLPIEIVQVYRGMGVKHGLYDWQVECLTMPGVLKGSNLVFAAPTSAGKSVVYEILALRRLLTTGKPFMLVLPTVVLCQQKVTSLERLLAPAKRKVKRYFGGINDGAYFSADTGAIVCVIERANMIVSRMMEEECLNQLSALVIDELHMVGDDDRGYLLELLLTKLRYATLTMAEHQDPDEAPLSGQTEFLQEEGVQVVGMSATMPNVGEVARWLGAKLYITSFRPVTLQQYIKNGCELKDASLTTVRKLQYPAPHWAKDDPDHVVVLVKETVDAGHSCLVFCASKWACEAAAKTIAKLLEHIPERAHRQVLTTNAGGGAIPVTPAGPSAAAAGGSTAVTPAAASALATGASVTPLTGGGHPPGSRAAVLAQFGTVPGGGEQELVKLVARGVAFHHSGLPSDERALVEAAYSSGAVSVLCCTSTLAVGVNLPARRVIFKHPYKGQATCPISVAEYRQMAGRAGRAGIDDAGESILIAGGAYPLARLATLLNNDPEPIASCLVEAKRGMKRAMVEVVASGAVSSTIDVQRYIQCTLLAATRDFHTDVKTSTIAALRWLVEQGFITWDKATETYMPLPLGKATLASGMDPGDALLIKADLLKAREAFVMATDLHLTFLVTPVRNEFILEWSKLYNVLERLRDSNARVMGFVGLNGYQLMQLKQGRKVKPEEERIAKKFVAALALHELINEVPMADVTAKYGLHAKVLQDLQDRAGKTAGMVSAFCNQLGWSDLEMLVAKFQGRIKSGVKEDIVALTEIPGVRGYRARLLYKAGLRTPEAVAACDISKLTDILVAGQSAATKDKTEDQARMIERRAARMIIQGAKDLLTSKAQGLKEQAAGLEAVMQAEKQADPAAAAGGPALSLPPNPSDNPSGNSAGKHLGSRPSPVSSGGGKRGHKTPGNTARKSGKVARTGQGPRPSSPLPIPKKPLLPGAGDLGEAGGEGGGPPQGPGGVGQVSDGAGGGAGAGTHLKRAAEAGGPECEPQPKRQAVASVPGPSAQPPHASLVPPQPAQHQVNQRIHPVQPEPHHLNSRPPPVTADPQWGATSGHAAQPGHAPPMATMPDVLQSRRTLVSDSSAQQGVRPGASLSFTGAQPLPPPQLPAQAGPTRVEPQVQALPSGVPGHARPVPLPSTSSAVQPQQPIQLSTSQGQATAVTGQHLPGVQVLPQQGNSGYGIQGNPRGPSAPPPHRPPLPPPANAAGAPWAAPGSVPTYTAASAAQTTAQPGHMLPPPAPYYQSHTGPSSGKNMREGRGSGGGGAGPGAGSYGHMSAMVGQPQQGQQQLMHPSPAYAASSLQAPLAAYPAAYVPEGADSLACIPQAGPPSGRGSGGGGCYSGHSTGAAAAHTGLVVPTTPDELRAAIAQLRLDSAGHVSFYLLFSNNLRSSDSQSHSLQLPDLPGGRGSGRGGGRQSGGGPESGGQAGPASGAHAGPATSGACPPPKKGLLGWQGELEGVALSGRDGQLVWVNLRLPDVAAEKAGAEGNGGGDGLGERERQDVEMVGLVLDLLQDPSVHKATYDLKMQVSGLHALYAARAWSQPGLPPPPQIAAVPASPAQPGGTLFPYLGLDLRLVMPLVDVVVAFWLLHPDSDLISDWAAHGRSGAKATWKVLESVLSALPQGGPSAVQAALTGVPSHAVLASGRASGGTLAVPQGPGSGGAPRAASGGSCGTAARHSGGGRSPPRLSHQLGTRQLEALRLVALSRKLWEVMYPRLCADGLLGPLLKIEMPLVPVLAGMESCGMLVDARVLVSQRTNLDRRLQQLEEKAEEAIIRRLGPASASIAFSLTSPKEVSELLFEHMKLPVPPNAQRGKGRSAFISTNADVLEEMLDADPVVAIILEHRKLNKLLGSLNGHLEQATKTDRRVRAAVHALEAQRKSEEAARREGRQHKQQFSDEAMARAQELAVSRLSGQFAQTGTETGRLAMDEPNLQTVPRPAEYVVEASQSLPLGGDGSHEQKQNQSCRVVKLNIRAAFVAPPGHVILAVDYSQVELRMMAHTSGDPVLRGMLSQEGCDPFKGLAASWLGCPVEQVTRVQRDHAKHMAYGLLYGMGPMALASALGVSPRDAMQLSDGFKRTLPGVEAWKKTLIADCYNTEYVSTLAGRRRWLPNITSSNRQARSKAERQAVNTVTQGSAADLIKTAMVALHTRLAQPQLRGAATLILQVHDELVYEVQASRVAEVAEVVTQEMSGAWPSLTVPIPVKLSVGPSWGELQEMSLEELRAMSGAAGPAAAPVLPRLEAAETTTVAMEQT